MDQQKRFWEFYKSSMAWKDLILNNKQVEKNVNSFSANNLNQKSYVNKFDNDKNYINLEESNNLNDFEEKILDDNFFDFISKTRIHQLERKKIKEDLKLQEEKFEYKDITDFERKNLSVVEEPVIREDLYGDKAKSIYLKEMKLQFNYNEFCDNYNPSFWPIIPINLNMKQFE